MSQAPQSASRRAGLLAAAGLLYASACGGPYGTEDFVTRTGPGLLVILISAGALLWGVPMALATAELSARQPIEGGYYRWVKQYLGDYWGFQAGLWSLFSSVLDNALYPVLFATALEHWTPGLGPLGHWLAAVAFIALLTWLNVRGIRVVGGAAVALNLFLIAPLVWMVLAAIPRWRFNPFVPLSVDPGNLKGLGAGLALAIWFHSGYTEVSTAAEEIENPRRTIPLVLLIVTPLVILSYVLPTVAGLAAVGGWESWESGQFVEIGEALGGPLLGGWALLASVASFVVIFMSYLLWWSRLARAFATDGFLPAWLVRRHPRFGTPHRILILYACLYSLLALAPFEELLVVEVWVFGAYDLLLVLSVFGARRSSAPEAGAFRIPGGLPGVALTVAVLATTWLVLLVSTARDSPREALIGGLGLLAGPVLYFLLRRLRGRSTSVS